MVYIDNIITMKRTFEEHIRNICKVIEKLVMANLKLNPSQFNLFSREVSYLRHVTAAEDVRRDSEEISAVSNWKRYP